MSKPECAQKGPYEINVEEGKTYYWCACGRSKKQPFCDGSHKGTEFKSIAHKAEKSETVYFCGCKATKTPPFCDGSHEEL